MAALNEMVWRTHLDRHLGELQGVRRAAAHLHLRGVPVSAVDKACRAAGEGVNPRRRRALQEDGAAAASAFSIAGCNAFSKLLGVIGPISL